MGNGAVQEVEVKGGVYGRREVRGWRNRPREVGSGEVRKEGSGVEGGEDKIKCDQRKCMLACSIVYNTHLSSDLSSTILPLASPPEIVLLIHHSVSNHTLNTCNM
jgi:hypothetical protein